MNEIWKVIPDTNGRYEVSDLGKIRNIELKILMAQHKDYKGYPKVRYINSMGKRLTQRVHRLIGKAFIPNIHNKPQINHKNGIKDDNRAENLEWVTNSENTQHSFDIGVQCNKGEKHPSSKISEGNVILMRLMYPECKVSELSELFNVTYNIAHCVCSRRTWNHI